MKIGIYQIPVDFFYTFSLQTFCKRAIAFNIFDFSQ